MTDGLAITLASILWVIALMHAYWGFGHVWPAADAKLLARTVVGARNIERMPPPASCFAVAFALCGVGLWPLMASRLVTPAASLRLVLWAGMAFALTFLARGVAAYTAAWRRLFPEQPFASLDRRYYAPLCLALGVGFIILVLQETSP